MSNFTDIELGIQSPAQRYCWAAYFVFGVLSSFFGDTLILMASLQEGAFKINKILVTIIQHIAVSDLANTFIMLLPVIISLLANSWIFGTFLCHAKVCLGYITYPAGMYLIAVLTTAKFLILRYPLRAASWSTKRVHQVCCLIWVCLLIGVPNLFFLVDKDNFYFDYREYTCQHGFGSKRWSTIRPIVAFFRRLYSKHSHFRYHSSYPEVPS